MFSSAEKTTNHTSAVQQKTAGPTFFRKAGEDGFFGAKETTSFFQPAIQAKLSVSSPDDPQEKEADEMADHVMRMPEPVAATQEKEEEKIQAKDEGIERSGALFVNTTELKPEKKGKLQAKLTSSLHRSDVIQQSGRGPPAGSPQFEQNLASSKGSGSALPADTRQFMENRFGADFSDVRIHTDTRAETLNRDIHAQAFTHGADIYFNAGKYAPNTAGGGFLLAHELTHTIQQGASKNISSNTQQAAVARKNIIQRSPDGSVPSQLTNAVAKAKSEEGKINANKEGADGFREGWESLVDIFKTTFGEDKIVSGSGGSYVPGTISEMDIKKKRIQKGALIVDPVNKSGTTYGERDAMPSWCGIFVFWALNKSGVPMPKWQLGRNVMKPEAAYPPGHTPRPGDIAYRSAYSHFAMVESVSGNTVRTINGNTAGEDNLGGQVQSHEHPVNNWTGFFNPLLIMEGSLGSGEETMPEKPKTLSELRKELFNINRKEGEDQSEIEGEESQVQSRSELSNWSVNESGTLSDSPGNRVQEKEEEQGEEEKMSAGQTNSIQKKEFEMERCADACTTERSRTEQSEFSIARQIEDNDSSLNSEQDTVIVNTGEERERGPPVQAKSISGQPVIQRSVIDDALSYVSTSSILGCVEITDFDATQACVLRKAQEVALHIPGYKALRVVLGEDPITGQDIERNGRNFIEAAFDIMPGGSLLHQKLDEQHQLDAAAAWMDEQISKIENLVDGLLNEFAAFWNELGITDLSSPMEVLREGAGIVLSFIDDVIDFAVEAAKELLERVKEYLLAKIVEFIKEQTPAYELLRVILGKDPITEEEVDRNGTNILNALLELGGEEGRMQRTQMQETGTFQKVADYIDEGIKVFGDAYDQIVQGFHHIWDIVGIESLMDPTGTFREIYNVFAPPVLRVLAFVIEVGTAILSFIKEVLMQRLSAWARTVRGYHLVTVIIGEDPFTGELVPRSVANIIRGFMSLMEGGEEQFNQLKESGAIGRAAARINAAVEKLGMTPAYIIQLFIDLWNSFSLSDLANPPAAFARILAKFGEPIGRLIAFVVEIIKIVILVVLQIMNFPFDVVNNIITRAMEAFDSIKRDPVGFLRNLLRAIKQGFIQFFDNIATHLLNGLTGWLLHELKDANVTAPTDFSLGGIISWVLEILGISKEKIWEKLAAHPKIGPERVAKIRGMIDKLEGIWTFIKDVQERGIAAIWDKIKEQLSNLWNVVLQAITKWVTEKIIIQVTIYLLGLLDPTFIMSIVNSVIIIYRSIRSFIKYAEQMLNILNSFVNGVADIAAGNITTAANYLENTMDKAMPVVVGFLADLVGLGGAGKKVAEMIESVREMVDKALTWLVNKAVDTGFAILDKLIATGKAVAGAIKSFLGLEENYTNEEGENHTLAIKNDDKRIQVTRASGTPQHISLFLAAMTTEINNPASTLSSEEKDQIRKAIAEAETVINSIEAISYPEEAPEEETKRIQQQMNTHLSRLKRLVQIIDRKAAPVPPVAVVPGFSSNLASTLSVKYLLKGHHPPGTPASEYVGDMHGATPVLRTIGLYPLKWVNFHLLNHNYGGLAVDSNLVPTSKGLNNNYKDTFEESFKGLYEEDPTGPKVMWFNAGVKYRPGTPFALSIVAEGGAMKADGREWKPDPAFKITPWSEEVPPPVAEAVAINRLPATQDMLRQVAKYTPLSAELLILLARIKPPVVMGKSTLLSVLATYAGVGLDDATHARYIDQINLTEFDFSR